MQTEQKTQSDKMKKTELIWDKYMEYLIEAINESNFMKRSETKPMATPKDDLETHLTSRATHARNAADIAKRIAKGLDLNYEYAYAGMLMHDAGHPFSAHEGEEMFTQIGKIYNTQYFHHNAKGVEVIESENICEKAIAKIPNIKNNPELRKQLIEEFPYFLDIVVSHDGEANAVDMQTRETEYPDIKTAVTDKVANATALNKYKCIAQTPEGKIAKYADVIAYLATDIRDGFRLGIYKDFPEEYLELFGEMFAEDYVSASEEKIQIARSVINKIKDGKLRELVQDAREEENKEIIDFANKITKEISEQNINFEIDGEKVLEIANKYINTYKEQKEYEKMTNKEKAFVNSETQRIIEFVGKKLRVRSSVVTEVTSMMQEYFINDLLKTSETLGKLQFSPVAQSLFFEAKKLDYETYVPATKWLYQKHAQPKAAYNLVKICSKNLIKSGVIANKFYDRSIRKYITDPEALECLETKYREPEEYEKYKQKQHIRDIKTSHKRYTSTTKVNKTSARAELSRNIYEYAQNEGKTFAEKYLNTFKAIETQITDKVEKATDSQHKITITANPKNFNELYISEIDRDIDDIRKLLRKNYENIYNISSEEKEKITANLVRAERKKMEEKMAIQISIDYLAGMTDRGFNELAIRTGCMNRKELIDKVRVDQETALQNDEKIKQLSEAMSMTANNEAR